MSRKTYVVLGILLVAITALFLMSNRAFAQQSGIAGDPGAARWAFASAALAAPTSSPQGGSQPARSGASSVAAACLLALARSRLHGRAQQGQFLRVAFVG